MQQCVVSKDAVDSSLRLLENGIMEESSHWQSYISDLPEPMKTPQGFGLPFARN
jgi:hypothetical protein